MIDIKHRGRSILFQSHGVQSHGGQSHGGGRVRTVLAKNLPHYFTPLGATYYFAKTRKLLDGRIVINYIGHHVVLNPNDRVYVE